MNNGKNAPDERCDGRKPATNASGPGDALPEAGIVSSAPQPLDAFFAAARAAPAAPLPEALTQRLTAQSMNSMPARRDRAVASSGHRRRFERLGEWLAGLQGLAGAATAGLAGLWIGLALPGPADTLGAALWPQGPLAVSTRLLAGNGDDRGEAAGLFFDDAGLWAIIEAEQEGWR